MKKIYKLIIILAVFALFGAGCVSISKNTSGSKGGVFKSVNGGQDWLQKSIIPTSSGLQNFNDTNIRTFAIDPQDHNAIYAGTRAKGMFYSFNGGESWRRTEGISDGFIATIAVDPEDKCVVYVATNHRILKTEDCNRTYKEIYRETVSTTFITAFAIDPRDNNKLYAGTIKGQLVKSIDAGKTWSLENTFLPKQITSIMIDPKNSNVKYVGLVSMGLWTSIDNGSTYTNMSDSLKKFKTGTDIRHVIIDPKNSDHLIVVTTNKILNSMNRGESWRELPIISPENVPITAFVVNPISIDEIYYGTATTFYHSNDGGDTWSTKKLPTTRGATALLVDYANTATIYLGSTELGK